MAKVYIPDSHGNFLAELEKQLEEKTNWNWLFASMFSMGMFLLFIFIGLVVMS